MNEIYTRCNQIEGIRGQYEVESIHDTLNGITFTFYSCTDKKNKVQVIFEPYVESYRNTTEGFRMKSESELHEQEGEEYGNWTFFTVTNSSYLKWLSEETYGYTEEFELIHYFFLCEDTIIDVIVRWEPRVTVITETPLTTEDSAKER